MITRPSRVIDLDAVWATASRLGEFSYASLAAEAHIGIKSATRITGDWLRVRAIEPAGPGVRGRLTFRVVDGADVPRPEPVTGTCFGNMWRSMQLLQSFSPIELGSHSHTPTVAVSLEDATGYCQMLARAGYLRVVRKAAPPARPAIYRLIRNTGPKPPVLRRIRALVDQNEGRIVHVAGGLK